MSGCFAHPMCGAGEAKHGRQFLMPGLKCTTPDTARAQLSASACPQQQTALLPPTAWLSACVP